jgi:hypothetical protein
MSAQIDFRTLPINVPSLCIPRVFMNIDEKRIRRIFDELNMGDILRIDVVSKTTEKGEKFNRVFIHFKQWLSNQNSDTARERLLNGKEIKIIYDDPWFWKVSAYKAPSRPPRQEAKPVYKKPSLQFDSDEDRPREDNRKPREDNRRPREDNRRPREDNRRPREDNRRPREEVINAIPRSPSNSPPRERSVTVNYTQVIEKKKPFVIEEGEIV